MEKLLLCVPEVAERLTMSRSKVYQLIQSGALRSVRIDHSRRVRVRDLEAFVAGLSPEGRSDPAA